MDRNVKTTGFSRRTFLITTSAANAHYDQLVEEARRMLDPARRKALYTEGWSIVNAELPHFHLHEVVATSAAVKALQGYQPSGVGALSYRGGGFRTAYIEA
jgi:peptide/nickel transport system substrate-binding protein